MPSKAGMLAKVLKPATVGMTSATMSTAAGPPESVGKSALVEKQAINMQQGRRQYQGLYTAIAAAGTKLEH
jgi:hypothetical protein